MFRKANYEDIEKINAIYLELHTLEEEGMVNIGWVRNVYPTLKTAEASFAHGDLFVAEDNNVIVGAAIINNNQVEDYKKGKWTYDVPDFEVMVLHTLVISPKYSKMGYGKQFVAFYEKYALSKNCVHLRMDTNAKNLRARQMYKKLGYTEIGVVPCDFNGIKGIDLVLLEKILK